MKRKLLLAGTILTGGVLAFFLLKKNSKDVEKLRKEHQEYIQSHEYSKTMRLSKKQRLKTGLPPNKFFEQEYLLEINPTTKRTHPENVFALQQKLKEQRKLQRVPGDEANNPWIERGPNNVGGRTRVVMFDPNDATAKRVFAGGVSGGLWVNNDITNANSSWIQVGIPENLSVTCMTVDPNNSNIFYLGTGESYTGDDAMGNGVWKSVDGGNSWVNVFRDNFNADLSQRLLYINAIKAWNNPATKKTEVFIGVAGDYYREGRQFVGEDRTGLYKTVNNGGSWSLIDIKTSQGSQYEPNDIEILADNSIMFSSGRNIFGHGGGTIFKSTDGNNFSIIREVPNGSRVEISTSSTNKDKIYVLAQISSRSAPVRIEKTVDGFNTVSVVNLPSDADTGIPDSDFTRGQSFYDLLIETDPTDDEIVYVGGIDLFRSADGGKAWGQISKWSNNNNLADLKCPLVHADQHAMVFHPKDANKAIFGNDGGVFYATSLSNASFTSNAIVARNKEYNVTQFYHGSIGQDENNELLLAGAQDNGSQFIEGASSGINSSVDIFGGDGAYEFIDEQGRYAIVSFIYNVYAYILLPTSTNFSSIIINDQDSGSFINTADLDHNLDILYTNGSTSSQNRISRFTGLAFNASRKDFTDSSMSGFATAIKVSPFTNSSSTLIVGTSDGKILKIEKANTDTPTWKVLYEGVVGSVSKIEFGSNENEILVTYHNYGVKSVWYSSNGGNTWQDKEGDLPDIPVKAIMMNPLNNNQVILGTELGVWTTNNFKDASPKWVQANNGMSNVKVTAFDLRNSDNTVLAVTYGRGMFTGKFTAATASVSEVLKDEKQFTVYPTASNGKFTIFGKANLGKATYSIFDVRGKQVFAGNINFTENEKQKVSVNLNSGIYILNLVDENNRKSSRKIIIK